MTKQKQFYKNPYIGMIYTDGKRTYEFMNNPFHGVLDGCKPQASWVEITLELK